MKNKSRLIIIFLIGVFGICPTDVYAEKIELTMSALSDGKHEYFYDLLIQSLRESGYDANIVLTPPSRQPYITEKMKAGKISIRWYLEAKRLEEQFTPVNVYLTNGLIGQRVLVVNKKDVHHYENIKTLDQFRKLNRVAALGKDWFDIDVWKHNRLPFMVENGEWRFIFPWFSFEHKNFDYFPRSVIEVKDELRFFPDVVIEPNLLLIYKNDFKFYLSHTAKTVKPFLEKALIEAKKSGLMDRLIEQHWGYDIKLLNLDKRTVIHLEMPPEK